MEILRRQQHGPGAADHVGFPAFCCDLPAFEKSGVRDYWASRAKARKTESPPNEKDSHVGLGLCVANLALCATEVRRRSDYCAKPMRRSRSWNRGSLRSGSQAGDTLRETNSVECCM